MSARRVRVPSLLGDPGIGRARAPERRFLFAVPPLAGHVAPVGAVAAELARRGHKVAWTGHRPSLEPLLRPGSRVFSAADDFGARVETVLERWEGLRDVAALRFFWDELLVPLGHAMMPGVERAIDRFRPDAVVCDQLVLAAPVAARLREIPWATAAVSPAEFTRPLAGLPEVEQWVRDRIGDFQLDHDIDDLLDLRFSDHLVLCFSTGALVGDTSVFPDHFAFVGPILGRSAPAAFPWEWLDGRPAVLVAPGMDGGPPGEGFLRAAAGAVRDMDIQAIFVAPPGAVGGDAAERPHPRDRPWAQAARSRRSGRVPRGPRHGLRVPRPRPSAGGRPRPGRPAGHRRAGGGRRRRCPRPVRRGRSGRAARRPRDRPGGRPAPGRSGARAGRDRLGRRRRGGRRPAGETGMTADIPN
ncbi:hypothetical protein LUW76_11345 [Actinomadura madurae]|nr:hypothetical protein [Actinomadura madurae]URM94871.1 hypothetical protein LUW76_11345 [Actinomadura madurae]